MNASLGRLYVVATPIGNLQDFSPRAIQTLNSVDWIAAEDTRHSGSLLRHFSIRTPTLSLHQHNEEQRSQVLMQKLLAGESVAVISDAGTPLISDPGYPLVHLARAQGIEVCAIPGPCAMVAALSVSGLPAESFVFEGFLPQKSGPRRAKLQQLRTETRTLVLYESPKRILHTLSDLVDIFGPHRRACLARELTKLHETTRTLPVGALLEWVQNDLNQQRGEIVLVVAGGEKVPVETQSLEHTLNVLCADLPMSQAVAIAAKLLGMKKNQVYQFAMSRQLS